MPRKIAREKEFAAVLKLQDAAQRYCAQVSAYSYEPNAANLKSTEGPRLEFEQASREMAALLAKAEVQG